MWWNHAHNGSGPSGKSGGHPPDLSDGKAAKIGRVILGCFVLWQLTFLLLSPLLDFLSPELNSIGPRREERGPIVRGLYETAVLATEVTHWWAGWIDQPQSWALFGSRFPPKAIFPRLTLEWNGPGPNQSFMLESPREPTDPTRYWNPPGPADRLFNYESQLLGDLLLLELRTTDAAERNRYIREEYLPKWNRELMAYLRWRMQQFHAAHPDSPDPDRLTLSVRFYDLPMWDGERWKWQEPYDRTVGCWRVVGTEPATGRVRLEACDSLDSRSMR